MLSRLPSSTENESDHALAIGSRSTTLRTVTVYESCCAGEALLPVTPQATCAYTRYHGMCQYLWKLSRRQLHSFHEASKRRQEEGALVTPGVPCGLTLTFPLCTFFLLAKRPCRSHKSRKPRCKSRSVHTLERGKWTSIVTGRAWRRCQL